MRSWPGSAPCLGRSRLTIQHKAWALARFYDFLVLRYQGDVHRLTGSRRHPGDRRVQPATQGRLRRDADPAVGRGDRGAVHRVAGTASACPEVPACGPRLPGGVVVAPGGLRIRETYMLDIRDWRRDLGAYGKIHVRYGKGSRGRGPKPRLVPAINGVRELLDWWMVDVRHQFGDDYDDPDAPLLPSERRDSRHRPMPAGRGPGAARRPCSRRCRNAAGLVGTAYPPYLAAFLRLVAVCPGNGPQGDPGASRP